MRPPLHCLCCNFLIFFVQLPQFWCVQRRKYRKLTSRIEYLFSLAGLLSGQSSLISIQSSMKYWWLSNCLWKMWVLNHIKVTKPLVMWNDDIELGVSGGKCAAHLSHDNNNNSLTPTPHGTGCRLQATGHRLWPHSAARDGTMFYVTKETVLIRDLWCSFRAEQRPEPDTDIFISGAWPWGRGQVRVRKARKGELSLARLQEHRAWPVWGQGWADVVFTKSDLIGTEDAN